MSKGEDKIAFLLKSAQIPYYREYSYPNLKHKGHLLRFDFAVTIPLQAIILIEYDGEAHFQKISHFHKTNSQFKQAQERDRIKNRYCLLHNIPLIRIPYWELEDLTLYSLFNNPKFKVTSIYHNDFLINTKKI